MALTYTLEDAARRIQELEFELAELKKGARLGNATNGMILAELHLRITEGHGAIDYKPTNERTNTQ